MKKLKSIIIFSFSLLISSMAFSQGIVVPGGTGAYGNMVYGGIGILSPEPYVNKSDIVASLGVGLGDPVKGLGFEIGSSMLNLSSTDLYNAGVKVHRYLGKGIYGAIGIENLLSLTASGAKSDGALSEYISFSQMLSEVSTSPVLSRFSYTLGAGAGRFSKLSVLDEINHPNSKATWAFGALAFKFTKSISGHLEWTGTNLNSGISLNGKIFSIPFSVMFAAADLTNYTGDDKVRFIGGIGTIYKFKNGPDDRELMLNKILENQEKESLRKLLESPCEEQIDSIKKLQDKIKQLQSDLDNCNKNTADLQDKLNKCNANNSNNFNNGENPQSNNVENHQGENVSKLDPKTRTNSSVPAGYYVVIHTFKYENQAIRATEIEKKKNNDSQILNNKTRKLFYVYTSYFKNLKEALKRSKEEREKGHVGTWVHIY